MRHGVDNGTRQFDSMPLHLLKKCNVNRALKNSLLPINEQRYRPSSMVGHSPRAMAENVADNGRFTKIS
jgi:hypothetical protein